MSVIEMGAVWSYVVSTWRLATEIVYRCGIRFVFWSLTVLVGLYPPVHAAGVDLTWDFYGVIEEINKAGFFRDFFYIVVVIAIMGICDIFGSLVHKERPNRPTMFCYAIAFLWLLYVVVYGTGQFSDLAGKPIEKFVLSEGQLWYDAKVIGLTGIVGLFVELLLAFKRE